MTRRHRAVATVAVALAVVLVSGACGSSKYRYVADSDTNTYVKVPRSWASFDESQLTEAQAAVGGVGPLGPLDRASLLDETLIDEGVLKRTVKWRMAFDGDPDPSLGHVVTPGNRSPVVDVLVRDISELREDVSLSTLKDIFSLQIALMQGKAEAELGPGQVIQENLQFDNGLRGMRLIAGFEGQDGEPYTFDQTALLDGTTQQLYVLSMRAGEKEYIANYKLLDEIAKSFTVKQKG